MSHNVSRRQFVKLTGAGALGVGAASVLAACGGSGSEGDNATAGDTIKIGVLGPYSGDVSQYGIACRNGAELYFDQNPQISGKTVSLDEQDEKGDATEAVNAYNKMIQDGVAGIVGDVTSTPTISVAQASVADNLPCVTPSATAAAVVESGSNYFRACVTDPFQGKVMADFASNQGWKTIGTIFNSGDDYSTGVNSAFVSEAGSKGLDVPQNLQQGYAQGDTDFNAQLTAIISATPDAIFVPDYYQDVAKIIDQARKQGYSGPIFGVDGWSNVNSYVQDKSQLANCYYCCSFIANNDDQKVKDFVSAYKNKFNEDPTNFCALGYDAAMVLAKGIEKALEGGDVDLTSDDGKQKVIDAIAGNTVDGVTGSISYDGSGDPVKSTLVISFGDDGTEQVFSTIDA